jgi:hypothetical protein
MPDLAQQIRDRLDGLEPTPAPEVSFPAHWTAAQCAQWVDDYEATKVGGFPASVPPAFVEPAEPASPEEIERWQKAWDDLLPEGARVQPIRILPSGTRFFPGFEQMRAAILAVVDYTEPGEPFPHDNRDHAEKATDAEVEAQLARVRELIAEKLGIEASGG